VSCSVMQERIEGEVVVDQEIKNPKSIGYFASNINPLRWS
jgi:hypothetical protein